VHYPNVQTVILYLFLFTVNKNMFRM